MSHPDDEVRKLLEEAVEQVEPADRLSAIRGRVAERDHRFAWLGGAVAVAAATAAVVGGVQLFDGPDDEPAPSGSPAPATSAVDPEAWGQTPPIETPSHAVAAYYLGDGPRGPVLYREFRREEEPVEGLAPSLAALMETPADPDYRTAWRPGDLVSASFDGETITVDLAPRLPRARPDGVSRREAEQSVQQVIYTLQAAVGARAPVRFLVNDAALDRVHGVQLADPMRQGPVTRTLALVSVTTPESGQRVTGSFTAAGVASSFEATVPWQLLDGDRVVREGFATAEGWIGEMLYPWQVEIDLAGLEPGAYTFVARTDDPTGGAEGPGPFQDTKAFTVTR